MNFLSPPSDPLRQAGALRKAGDFEAQELDLKGPLLVSVRRFSDARGVFTETYNRRDFQGVGIANDFVHDNQSCR
ncbi:dTDP-4-dehydrorhamnose 3,5-epimerase family protein [Falsiroseomonas sp.]|uniref:dTDP-4-dehydrorhamnose 3,5-epimerase family protein n=1 Tax=Falsiroseomonas sp. TaxID=2870721 RepID=UPI002724978A|nr:dTDP-4-dehydrorhamnose 3,5-epimerase family protein [Falsiroseomonas sp.]MDO9499924.1 dTDP-4-dehydrorhamnose 3,5-epimerase family protein [Falsiroseomonas sp.]